ncbi:M23 family metallopeptidase [Gordonia soli]|uniref:M23ase beta-sheet core domain-containing protein n=1 Tax=Gordonia soli NBRC 108243 TaxID=1223545 RepID=M0QLU9_9ACTN|nr:M23 family metallopeptidase [Gordonia soli]GAC69650.1 hypothetical protein GS4_26_00980 [Gordonia soli NBRC 108243]
MNLVAVVVTAVLLTSCSGADSASTATSAAASASTSAANVITPVTGAVMDPPIPVPATDGKTHLVYEVALTNPSPQRMTIRAVEVKGDGKSLLTLDQATLSNWLRVFGTSAPTDIFSPGQAGRLWLDVAVDADAVPRTLSHVVTVAPEKPEPPLLPAQIAEPIAEVTVSDQKPVEIAPPLRGAGWFDANGCCEITPHRGAANPIDGSFWLAERFAIDFVQLDPAGRLYVGDPTKVESYPYFDDDIHAVAPGRIVGLRDDLPEQTAGTAPTGLPLDQYAGNHIVQQIGDGRYVLYAHLTTGSLGGVKVGDDLTEGQTIAKLGNTDAPHLHFHVMSHRTRCGPKDSPTCSRRST